MTESLSALASENLNPGLNSLLQDVQRGHIRVPRFQRPFVWDDKQRLLLLESIRENMPIGSLLLWRTGKLELACFNHIGPHAIQLQHVLPATVGWQYLLDGHQRISTLLSVLMPPAQPDLSIAPSEDDTQLDWDIQYDLMHQEFIFTKDMEAAFPKPPLLPLWTLFDGRLVNRHMREMRKQAEPKGWLEQDFDTWEERADQLAYRFQQYKIPILVMTTDDLDLAARTFQRINSQGTKMDETHLVTALTWTPDFNLREKLAALNQELPPAWRELDEKLFLQVCKGLVSIDMRSVSEHRLVAALKADATLLPRAAEGLAGAIELLVRMGGVVREDLLPYSMQLVFLALELVRYKAQPVPEIKLMEWFWRTSWAEAFGTSSSRRVKAEQDALRSLSANNIHSQWQWKNAWNRLAYFDVNYARNRVWMLSVAQRTDLVDEEGKPVNGRALLEKYGKEAFVKLFPEPSGASPKLKRLLNTVGNRFLTDPTRTFALRKCLTSEQAVPRVILFANFIDNDELNILRADNLEGFIEARNARIARWVAGEYSKLT